MSATARRQGKLVLFTGPMASGKTTALHREQQMAIQSRYHKPFSIGCSNNPVNAERGCVLSRSGGAYEAHFTPTLTPARARWIIDEGFTDVFIDEAQFFATLGECELKDFCSTLLKARLSVYVSALNSDFRGEPWPAISHLLALSPIVEMHHAWCDGEGCGDKAYHTYRESAGTSKIDVHATYVSLCRNCWYERHREK